MRRRREREAPHTGPAGTGRETHARGSAGVPQRTRTSSRCLWADQSGPNADGVGWRQGTDAVALPRRPARAVSVTRGSRDGAALRVAHLSQANENPGRPMEPATPDTPSVVQDNDADEPVLNTYRFRLLGQAVARPRPRACDVIGTPDQRPPREPTMLPALSARCAHEWWGGIEAPTLLAPQFEAALASSPKRLKTMSCDLMALRDLLVRYAEASERGKELAAHLHEPILAALGVHDGKPSRCVCRAYQSPALTQGCHAGRGSTFICNNCADCTRTCSGTSQPTRASTCRPYRERRMRWSWSRAKPCALSCAAANEHRPPRSLPAGSATEHGAINLDGATR